MTKTMPGAQRDTTFTAQVYTFFQTHFYGILLILLFVGVVLLHPSVSSLMWGWQRERLLQDFISQVVAREKLDAQAFWQFREFYSPGEFSFNPQAVGVYQTLRITALPENETWLLRFNSPHLSSTDSIIQSPEVYMQKVASVNQPIFQNHNTTIFESSQDQVSIVFYTSIDTMMLANGFFDYLPPERELLQGKYWLNETVVTTK